MTKPTRAILEAVAASDHAMAAQVKEHLDKIDAERADHKEAISQAHAQYADNSDNDIEIDDDDVDLSVADDGVWVSAWVWVPNREANNDDQG